MTTYVLGFSPLGGSDMSKWMGGWAKQGGRVFVKVPTTDNPPNQADPLTVKADGVAAKHMVLQYLTNPADNVVLFGHSRGCQVIGEWLAVWMPELTTAQAARVRVILSGNLERPRFGFHAKKPRWFPAGNSVRLTPENTRIPVLDIGRKGDLWANYPGGALAISRLLLCMPHLDYSKVNPDNYTPLAETVVGNTRYVTVA